MKNYHYIFFIGLIISCTILNITAYFSSSDYIVSLMMSIVYLILPLIVIFVFSKILKVTLFYWYEYIFPFILLPIQSFLNQILGKPYGVDIDGNYILPTVLLSGSIIFFLIIRILEHRKTLILTNSVFTTWLLISIQLFAMVSLGHISKFMENKNYHCSIFYIWVSLFMITSILLLLRIISLKNPVQTFLLITLFYFLLGLFFICGVLSYG